RLEIRPRSSRLPPTQTRQRPDCNFSKLDTQPTCTPVYASPNPSRCAAQTSGPSGSLLLSRRTLSFPASCRFIPAHCEGDFSSIDEVPVDSTPESSSHLGRLTPRNWDSLEAPERPSFDLSAPK